MVIFLKGSIVCGKSWYERKSITWPFESDMAVGNASATKRQLHELQQISQHSKCGLEPELEYIQAQELGVQVKQQAQASGTRELAKGLDLSGLGHDHGWPFYREVQSIHAKGRISSHGLLSDHGERSRRDSKAQHGSYPSTGLPQYADLAPVYKSQAFYPFR